MKIRYLALLLIGILPLMAFNCIVDDATVTLNIPFNGPFPVNPGNNPNYAGSVTINPKTLYDDSYTLTGASVYDIKVATSGPNLGNCSGTVRVNNSILFTYDGTWTQFNIPQSLLTSRLITRNQAGINELISAVVQGRNIVLSVAGSVTTTPVPTGCVVTISAFVQAYGHIESGD